MSNMADMQHRPFVHARTIGKHLKRCTGECMDMRWGKPTMAPGSSPSVRVRRPAPVCAVIFPT